jgi:hypothetical protein
VIRTAERRIVEDVLSPEESALLDGLREIPDCAVRDELLALLLDLIDYARHPECARAQGDGVPCTTVSLSCEQCQRVTEVFANARRCVQRLTSSASS